MTIERKENYSQVCVWPGTIIDEATQIPEFEQFFKDELGVNIQYLEIISTLPDRCDSGCIVEGTGGRHDILFAIHNDDVMKFAVPRLQFGIRWIEDVLDNDEKNREYSIYPQHLHEYKSW